jgi:hypothetical protein
LKYYHHLGITPTIKQPFLFHNVVDRTQKILIQPEMEILTPIGELCEPKSIEHLCYDSVQQILNSSENKRLYISWSGGIDSTLVLVEFLKIVPKDRIVVLMNKYSIQEYPQFYKNFIENQLEIKNFSFSDNSHLLDSIIDGVIVTGHCIDPVFGINDYDRMSEQRLFQSVPDFLKKLTNTSQDFYNNLIMACPRPLTNVKDLMWWLDYTLNYQSEQLMWILETDNINLGQNFFHFGSTKAWNDYAVSTPCEIKYEGSDLRNYKMALKKHIYKFTKDDDYTTNKIKYPSWRKYRTELELIKNRAVYITTDWKRGWSILK